MDSVETLNHLIPSDQLDDSLAVGQNSECETSNELGSGLQLDDSLKNMLSDKDPMFGCSSSQFNLLDNEESAFPAATSTGRDDGSAPTGLSGEMTVEETKPVKRPVGRPKKRPHHSVQENSDGPQPANTSSNIITRGRPGRKPADRLEKPCLIEKQIKGTELKKELTEGGRIDVNNLEGRRWLNPTVVLRRLTVTIAGFKIELLPGPSYTQDVDTMQAVCLEEDMLPVVDKGLTVLPVDAVNVQNPIAESVAEVDVSEKSTADDVVHGLSPYVNPNDVQTSNGTLKGNPSTQETKLDNQSIPEEQKPMSNEKEDINEPQCNENDITTVSKTVGKEKELDVVKNPLKSKEEPTPAKNKDLVSCKPKTAITEHKVSQNPSPSKIIPRGDLHKNKPLKDKKEVAPLKRPAENTQSEQASKVQRTQSTGDTKVKPKPPIPSSSALKKSPLSGNRVGDQQPPTKQTPAPTKSKVESAQPVHSRPSQTLKTPEEGGQEKPKLKKPEKILQRQKSKSGRSTSVEEPQLFIPDNAPVAKKEAAEEQPANSDTVWDGNNCCGLCKKHHNNTFMVGCGRCEDWFHGDCVGLDLTKVREMEEEDEMYVCLKCCDEESRKVEPEPPRAPKPEVPAKTEVLNQKLPPKPKPEPGSSQSLTSGGVRPDPDRRPSADARDGAYKTDIPHLLPTSFYSVVTGVSLKQEAKSKTSSSKKPVSVDSIRRSVRDSLKEILTQRLKESELSISVERAVEVAKKTERELFHLYKDTDNKYKNKYRSLMFNLKDTKNNVLFKRVLKGEISPSNLIRMSPEELASKELAAWRQRENRHTIEMIEKDQREAERRPITKITHKGEIEIESQEPQKTPEPEEMESSPKLTEVLTDPPKTPEDKAENTKTDKDTTGQHKSHLFDLHCKICTGRMAPPVEEAPTKVVKVATTVVRRQSTKSEETKSTAGPALEDDLHLTALEESFRSTRPGYESRSDHVAGRDEEALFLSNLQSLWRGFIHMHSVAKLVTKAFPVSGNLDNATEDLPDSIQVGGRISPQMVWDYLDKIRASGTKEVCLIRFSPESDEDEISYTLLYAYFSSRRRFGVVSNNRKQVKDMYLIPLGAVEKVPHQLVPFDGPGLENNRPNLLLGLIIRQRSKRDFLPVELNETGRIMPEIKPVTVSAQETRTIVEDEKLFLSSLTAVHKKEIDKPLNTTEAVDEPVKEALEETSASEEPTNQEPHKPLRFLPGVLLGWGGELPPLPDFGGAPAADDTPKIQAPSKTEASAGNSKSPTVASQRERFVIKKKEPKAAKAEPELSSPTDISAPNNSSGKDAAVVIHTAPISLKDKPPHVPTEAFLASLSAAPSGTETSGAASANKGDAGLLSETVKGATEGNSLLQSKSQTVTDHTNSYKPPLSGILKKSSAYSSVNEDKTTVLQKDKVSQPATSSPKPVPVPSSARSDPLTTFHQGYLQLSQAKNKPEQQNQSAVQSSSLKKEDPAMSQSCAAVTPTVGPPAVQGPPAAPLQQPQVPGSCDVLSGPPDNTFSTPNTQDQNHSTTCDQDSTSQDPGPQSQNTESPSQLSEQPPSLAKDNKRPEERYSDPWARPRTTEDRDHHGRHSHHRDAHHGKKSRHQDRDREKKSDRSSDDKYRERSRHHGHSEDRHAEKRKERHHSDEYSSRHKDRHRHRRDSDYENGRRSSKDSYS
ncbi:PHD finger protein 3 isoform X2 [Limanda limanda]|uniref:PHD finger protein 3 isoform X2 n=1 Tax=Limanda limanda TaxID=27771 RepID=UPI0029C9427C|nr:PHD finger protein 3 isoform X2 [Limanda limanda]